MKALCARTSFLAAGLVAALIVMLVWSGWPAHAGIGELEHGAVGLDALERSLLRGLGGVELRLCFALNAAWYTCAVWTLGGGAYLAGLRRPVWRSGSRPGPGSASDHR